MSGKTGQNGGVNLGGSVDSVGGDIVGGNKIISARGDVFIGMSAAQHGKRGIPEVIREALKALHDLDNAIRKTIGPLTRFDQDWREDQRRQALTEIQLLADTEVILPDVRRLVAELDHKLHETGDLSGPASVAATAVLSCGQATLNALGDSPVTPWGGPREVMSLVLAVKSASNVENALFVRDQAEKVLSIVSRQTLADADRLVGALT
jgi:hypothetical protein